MPGMCASASVLYDSSGKLLIRFLDLMPPSYEAGLFYRRVDRTAPIAAANVPNSIAD